VTKPLGALLGTFSDEVAKGVGFKMRPEPFDGIEIGLVARQEMELEVMPIQSLSFSQLALSTMSSRLLESKAEISWPYDRDHNGRRTGHSV
jgi:hypothetical protein